MPITPFHLGPGLLVKAALPGHFSLIAFSAVQAAIDTEVIVNIVRGHDPLHEFFHGWTGGLTAAACCAGLLMMITPGAKKLLSGKLRDRHLLNLLVRDLKPLAILNGAFIGALSHVALDGFMHSELNKSWLNLIGINTLHGYCFLAGVAGLCAMVVRWKRRMKEQPGE